MDKEHAKFILQSYRPDGADANDPHFAEALLLAAEDRELGEWLADERANDTVFTAAISSVDIPEGLREEILAVLEHDQSVNFDTDLDGVFFGAVASVQAPAGLRDQILSAMEVEVSNQSDKVVQFPKKWIALAAIAAILVVGFISLNSFSTNTSDHQIALHNVQIQSGNIINASNDVEFTGNSLEGVNKWLVNKGLPKADSIPLGLIETQTKGGRKVIFDNGVEASMIFFEKKDIGQFYLMVLKADSIEDLKQITNLEEINLKRCKSCPLTRFSVTSWKDNEKVYMLLSKVNKKDLIELF